MLYGRWNEMNLFLLLQAHQLTAHFWSLINHDCTLLNRRRGNSDYISDYQVFPLLSDFYLVLLNWIEISQMFWTQAFCLTEPFYRFYRVRTQFPLGRVERRCEWKKCWAGLGWKPRTEYQGTLQSTFSLFSPTCVPPEWISQIPAHLQCFSLSLWAYKVQDSGLEACGGGATGIIQDIYSGSLAAHKIFKTTQPALTSHLTEIQPYLSCL